MAYQRHEGTNLFFASKARSHKPVFCHQGTNTRNFFSHKGTNFFLPRRHKEQAFGCCSTDNIPSCRRVFVSLRHIAFLRVLASSWQHCISSCLGVFVATLHYFASSCLRGNITFLRVLVPSWQHYISSCLCAFVATLLFLVSLCLRGNITSCLGGNKKKALP